MIIEILAIIIIYGCFTLIGMIALGGSIKIIMDTIARNKIHKQKKNGVVYSVGDVFTYSNCFANSLDKDKLWIDFWKLVKPGDKIYVRGSLEYPTDYHPRSTTINTKDANCIVEEKEFKESIISVSRLSFCGDDCFYDTREPGYTLKCKLKVIDNTLKYTPKEF